jgi:hypothetical protein
VLNVSGSLAGGARSGWTRREAGEVPPAATLVRVVGSDDSHTCGAATLGEGLAIRGEKAQEALPQLAAGCAGSA